MKSEKKCDSDAVCIYYKTSNNENRDEVTDMGWGGRGAWEIGIGSFEHQ